MKPTTCVWFRKGLRVHDNAALVEAAAGSGSVLPLYVLDPYFARPEFVGAPRYRFLLESLADLDATLRARYGSQLCVVRGESEGTLGALMRGDCDALPGVKVDRVLWEEEAVEPWGIARDARVKAAGEALGVDCCGVEGGHTLFDPAAALAACGGKPPTTMPAMVKLADKLPSVAPVDAPGALPPLPAGCGGADVAVPTLEALGYAAPAAPGAFGVVGGETAGLARR